MKNPARAQRQLRRFILESGRRRESPAGRQDIKEKREPSLLFDTWSASCENKSVVFDGEGYDEEKGRRSPSGPTGTGRSVTLETPKARFITLRTDPTSGTYVVVGFAKSGK
jgi:hypothetical protein